jgi:protein O-GlcNAc transferase
MNKHLITLVLALGCFSFASTANADRASTLYRQAIAYKKQGKIPQAIAKLKDALQERSNYAAAHRSLGILYRRLKKYPKATYHLEQAAKLEPQSAQVHYSLGLVYFRAGHRAKAAKSLNKAATLDPKNAQLLASLGAVLIRMDPEQALRVLHKAVKLKPQDGEMLHQLGLAYRKAAGRAARLRQKAKVAPYMKKAEKYMVLASAFADKSARLHFDLGVLYRRTDRLNQAISHYERAVSLDPKLASAWWDLGHVYSKVKRNDDAVKAYQKYIDLRGGSGAANIARKRIKGLKGK